MIRRVIFSGPKKHELERQLDEAQRKLRRLERLCRRMEPPPYEPDEFCFRECAAPDAAFRKGWRMLAERLKEAMEAID